MLIGGRMNYVQLHLGDWIAGTLDLTPTERGVYMDLLVRYYKEERPLMQDECKRIARGYAPAEQEAMHYVLQRFFTLENGEYRQSRCDEEIEKAQTVSNKRKRAAASRWAKKPEIDASAYPNAEQTQCECNANGMLTNNRKPITNNQIVERVNPVNTTGGDFCPTVDDFGAAPEVVPEPPPAVTGTGVTHVTTYPFPDSLPEDWGIAAAKQRPDVSAEAVFLKLHDRLRERYPGEKRTMAMWLRQFLQWIATERVIGKPLGREETPEEKQKSIENAERFAAAMRKRLEEANK